MDTNRFDRLTRAQRECLRLYHQRYRIKQIAELLDGISHNTVSSYLTEAVAVLDAPGRPAAAAMLAAHEAAHPDARGRFSVGDEASVPTPTVVSEGATPPRPTWRAVMPFRTSEGTPNDLGIIERLGWIVILSLALAIGFGQLASGVRVVSDLIARSFR